MYLKQLRYYRYENDEKKPVKFQTVQQLFTTIMDCLRISDDYGKFKLQFSIGYPFVGMKGSYVIVKNSVEKNIGFDNGINSSITEDAYFAMKSWEAGYKFKFINGVMFERSPLSFIDLSMQRSRWYYGLVLLCLDCNINCLRKSILSLLVLIWSTITFSVIGFFWTIFLHIHQAPLSMLLVLGILWGSLIAIYNIGFYHNFDHKQNGVLKTIGMYILMVFFVVIIPIYHIFESLGVLVGMIKVIKHYLCCCCGPSMDFNVIKKSNSFISNQNTSKDNESNDIVNEPYNEPQESIITIDESHDKS